MLKALQSWQKMKPNKRHLTILSILAFVVASSAQGKESKCDVFPTEYCAQNITITIEKRHVELRKSLTLYRESQGLKEPVVMLNCVREYICETSEGYLCSQVTEGIFSIITPCEASDNFRLSVDGEPDILCVRSQQKKRNKSEDSLDSLQASKQSEDTTGISIGIPAATVLIGLGLISVATFVSIRRRQQSKQQSKNTADVESPLTRGKSEESENFPANSTDSQTGPMMERSPIHEQ